MICSDALLISPILKILLNFKYYKLQSTSLYTKLIGRNTKHNIQIYKTDLFFFVNKKSTINLLHHNDFAGIKWEKMFLKSFLTVALIKNTHSIVSI